MEGIRRALPILHSYNIYPAANLGMNRMMGKHWISRLDDPDTFTREATRAIRDFYQAAIDLGFTTVNACYPMNAEDVGLHAQYQATSVDEIVSFSPEEKARLFVAMAAVIPEFRSRIRIFSPVASLKALSRQHTSDPGAVNPCRGGVDFFYVSAHDGLAYPCGYRGQEPLGPGTSFDGSRAAATGYGSRDGAAGVASRDSWHPMHESVCFGQTYVRLRMVWIAQPSSPTAWKNTDTPLGTRK